MSYILLVLLLGSTALIFAETSTEIDRVKERLASSANQLSMTIFLDPPDADSYLNIDLVKNSPHKMNLSTELTKIIQEWSPRLLALDPTCPYYFSKLNNPSSPDEGLNLLSYLQAIESNTTVTHPFVNILPQSYRNALPLLSIFRCREHVYPSSSPFFHNIEIIVGPGQSELPFERQSNLYSQLYCSLYGWPHFTLIDQTKQPTTTYNAQTLLSQENLADVDFLSTRLAPGTCLFVPSDWVTGIQLNNSISLVFTLKKVEEPIRNESDYQPLPCTHTGAATLDTIPFAISDTFNVTDIGLIVYFYQYLNPPMFDKEYTPETFIEHFRQDKNVSQLIMKWTPELTELIKGTLFNSLDVDQDGKFSADDYFLIKKSNLAKLHNSIYDILESLRQTVLKQYNELNETISKITQQLGSTGVDDNIQDNLESIMDHLPDSMKEKLKAKSVNVKELIDKIEQRTKQKATRPSTNQQRVTEDDASILFNQDQDEEITADVDQDQEEDITAEPIIVNNETHRTDL